MSSGQLYLIIAPVHKLDDCVRLPQRELRKAQGMVYFQSCNTLQIKEDRVTNPTVDKDLCIGCALCTQVCSDVFEMRADGTAEVKAGADTDAACIQEAVDQCPVGAISA